MLKGKHLLWQTFNLSLYDFKAHAFSLVSQSPQAPQSSICTVAQYMPSTWPRDFTGVRTTEPSFLFSSSGCSDLALRIPIWKDSVEWYSMLYEQSIPKYWRARTRWIQRITRIYSVSCIPGIVTINILQERLLLFQILSYLKVQIIGLVFSLCMGNKDREAFIRLQIHMCTCIFCDTFSWGHQNSGQPLSFTVLGQETTRFS